MQVLQVQGAARSSAAGLEP